VAQCFGTPIAQYPCGSCPLFFTGPLFFEIRRRRRRRREGKREGEEYEVLLGHR
jgi:hypothetical protein